MNSTIKTTTKTPTSPRNSFTRIALSLSGAALLGFASVGLAFADGPDRPQTSNSGALPIKLSPPAPDGPGDITLPEADPGGGGGGGGDIGEAIALIVCPDGTHVEYNPAEVSDPEEELCPPMLGEPPYDPGLDPEAPLACEDIEPGVTFGELELREVWGWYMENCRPTPWSCETALRAGDDLVGARDWYGEHCIQEPVYEPTGEAPDRPGDEDRPSDDGDRPVPGDEPGDPSDEQADEPVEEPTVPAEPANDTSEPADEPVGETEEQELEEYEDEPGQPETTAGETPAAPLPPKAGAGNALTSTSGGIGLGIFALVATVGGAAGALLRSKTRA